MSQHRRLHLLPWKQCTAHPLLCSLGNTWKAPWFSFSTHQFCSWAAIFCWIILFKQSQEEEGGWQQTYRLWVQGPRPILRWRSTLKWMANLDLFNNVKPCPKENFKPESRVVWTKPPRVDTDWPEILDTIFFKFSSWNVSWFSCHHTMLWWNLDQDCHHAWSQGVAARTAYNFKLDRRPRA
jgi:hypothetical protein